MLPPAAAAPPVAPLLPAPAPLPLHLPPSGSMRMKVVRQTQRNPVYGIADFVWQRNEHNYSMQIDASLDLLLTSLRLYRLQSEGRIDSQGIQPQTMRETRRGHDETSTNFDYAQGRINFSAQAASVALLSGAQDRASIFMQLAGMAAAAEFHTGQEIDVQVAEESAAHRFLFQVGPLETIQTGVGNITAWHLLRPARAGIYNSSLELWLAPDYHWYPVQIRNTEPDGAVTTQTMSSITFINDLEAVHAP